MFKSGWSMITHNYCPTGGQNSREFSQMVLAKCEEILKYTQSKGYKYNVASPSTVSNMRKVTSVCCASYVSWVLAELGYENYINTSCTNFRSATALGNSFKNKFQYITSYSDLEAGDIIIFPGQHTQIYAGNNMWYNGGSTSGKHPVVLQGPYDARKIWGNNFYILRPIAP